MICVAVGPIAAYRMHTPRWATKPTSGEGAATDGGRANRPGVATLYLSLESNTAIREYQQLSPLVPPGTLVSYTVMLTRVVDFRGGFVAGTWSSLWEEFFCDWRNLWFNQRVEPPIGGAHRSGPADDPGIFERKSCRDLPRTRDDCVPEVIAPVVGFVKDKAQPGDHLLAGEDRRRNADPPFGHF